MKKIYQEKSFKVYKISLPKYLWLAGEPNDFKIKSKDHSFYISTSGSSRWPSDNINWYAQVYHGKLAISSWDNEFSVKMLSTLIDNSIGESIDYKAISGALTDKEYLSYYKNAYKLEMLGMLRMINLYFNNKYIKKSFKDFILTLSFKEQSSLASKISIFKLSKLLTFLPDTFWERTQFYYPIISDIRILKILAKHNPYIESYIDCRLCSDLLFASPHLNLKLRSLELTNNLSLLLAASRHENEYIRTSAYKRCIALTEHIEDVMTRKGLL